MSQRFNEFAGWCRRYINVGFIVMVSVLVYIMFFSDNSVIDYNRYQAEVDDLKIKIMECNDSIEYYENLNRSLSTDPATMERIVREEYHMQRPNEDIYLVE